MSAAQQLFPPWEPPPPFVPRPSDTGLEQRIAKLTEFVARNGGSFEEMMRQKQHGNPEFAFLFGGEGSQFYRWRLYCAVHQRNPELPLDTVGGVQHAVQHAPPGGAESHLPEEVRSGFAGVLENLNGTKEVIKSSQRWFLQNFEHCHGLAGMLLERCQHVNDYTKQLHIIYLINDILVHSVQSSTTQPEVLQAIRDGFLPVLSSILATAYNTSGKSDEAKQRLQKIIQMWSNRGVFGNEAVAQLEASAFSDPDAAAPPPAAAPAAMQPPQSGGQPPWQAGAAHPVPMHSVHAPQHPPWAGPPAMMPDHMQQASVAPWMAQQQQPPQHMLPHGAMQQNHAFTPAHMPPPPHAASPSPWHGGPQPGMPGGFGAPPMMPPHSPNPSMMHHAPPHGAPIFHAPTIPPQPVPAPEEPPQPVNPMCFPPGILPKLIDTDADRPYTPLELDTIQKEGLPAPGEMDAYLQSRLDKFFAEVHDYHGSKTRAQLLSERGQDPRGMLSKAKHDNMQPGGDSSRSMEVDPETGMRPDGSFARGRGDRAKGGLGSHREGASEDAADDPYSMYRRQKAGSYHKSAMAKSAGALPGR